jgi:hypothetical protein
VSGIDLLLQNGIIIFTSKFFEEHLFHAIWALNFLVWAVLMEMYLQFVCTYGSSALGTGYQSVDTNLL